MPSQPFPLIGRDDELRLARACLADDPHVRLLTLTGPGGTGKTRLAIEVAAALWDAFAGGIFFVDLAPVSDERLVLPTVARAVGLRESGDEPLLARLTRCLSGQPILLVLDNMEQVLAVAPRLAELLAACPALKALATSRAPLRLRWERVLPVPPLRLPPMQEAPLAVEHVAGAPAVALFVERAQAVDPAFHLTDQNAVDVAEICARLDGLPLALELAAARANVLPPRAMLARLERRLDLLSAPGGDLPVRQQTLRRAIDWSYDLLDEPEQAFFRRLGVFVGGCTLVSAGPVTGEADDLLLVERVSALVDHSLLRRDTQPDGEPRFSMLETIRAYALERLTEAGEAEETGRRLTTLMLGLAEHAEVHLSGPQQGAALDTLQREHDNLRGALRWCIEHGQAEAALRLAGALWRFWFTRGYLTEGSGWMTDVLGLSGAEAVASALRAKALNGAGTLAHARGDWDHAVRLHQEALALRRALADRRGEAVSLNSLGNLAVERGDYREAQRLYEESLTIRRDLGERRGIAILLNNLAVVARDQADWERAEALADEAQALFRELDDREGIALSLVTLGIVRRVQAGAEAARPLHEESLRLLRELGNRRDAAELLEVLAVLAAQRAQYGRAVRLFGAADRLLEELGSALRASRRPRFARCVSEARERLDEAAFTAAWAAGRAMSLDQAIEVALSDVSAARTPAPEVRNPKPQTRLLTRREQEVAALLARGYTNREIARDLVISERTAETHVCNILAKLGLEHRAQATAWAVEHGLAG